MKEKKVLNTDIKLEEKEVKCEKYLKVVNEKFKEKNVENSCKIVKSNKVSLKIKLRKVYEKNTHAKIASTHARHCKRHRKH